MSIIRSNIHRFNHNIAQYDAEKVKLFGAERVKYFEGIGVNVNNATSLETAINVSGLNFSVEKRPLSFVTQVAQEWNGNTVMVDTHLPFPKQFATIRTDTMEPIGIVGEKYEILQNIEAFNFLDSLVGDAKFETAGLYGGGSKSFITMSTEPIKILDDEFAPYILFTNAFDGSGAVRVMFTPIRVFCSNCIARAIKNATNHLSIKHSSALKYNLENAKHVLIGNNNYLNALKKESEMLATTTFTEASFEKIARQLFPINENDAELIQARNDAQFELLMTAYHQDDLQNFNNTAYKAVQAIADFESHKPSLKKSSQMEFKNIKTVMAGMPLLNQVTEMILASA